MLLKNSYGLTTILSPKSERKRSSVNKFAGSSLNRNPSIKKNTSIKKCNTDISSEEKIQETNEFEEIEEKLKKLRSMSPRTKQKIRNKVIAFSQLYNKLNFLTLTFINGVEDKQAVAILAKFLDNCNKQMKDFQYIWVAERQTKNTAFENNIHFHLITNKYFKISKYWEYWLKLQEKSGIEAREANFKASSAFDIRKLNAKNIKAIGQYITKYVTKNKDQFDCQVWNCSKKISMLYTAFYSGYEFIENVEKILEYELEPIPAEYCTIYPIPLNRKTLPMYERLNDKNIKTIKYLTLIQIT